jgi:amidophosphoribosyltransferase
VRTGDARWAIRHPLGLRPLCIGELELDGGGAESDAHAAAAPGRRGYLVASESCALGTVGARLIGEVAPGEIVRIDDSGIQRFPGLPETAPRRRQALCVFEYVYFARPDSVLEDQTIHHVRQRLGARLWEQAPVEADVVIGVPDSATPAAIGFSLASGIPYSEGLTKNRYIGRTFIQPNDQLRRSGVRLKYNPLSANLRGKRVVMVDDSIVRGNTCGPLVKLLRDGGASEVHVRVSSPPVRHPCFMGVDMATYEQLIAHRMDVEGIRAHIGADSLAYLEHGAMMEAVREAGESSERVSRGHCSACFSGEYPIKLDEFWQSKAAHRSEQPGRFRGIRGD